MGLREQAKLDARAILEDTSGFAWPVTLTSPLGVVASLLGFTADVGQTIDPETGQAVAGRRASVSLPRGALTELPEAISDKRRKPWLATFADSEGAVASWKVIDVMPDAALGVVVLLVELYALATVKFAASTLTLPSVQLSGTFAPAVSVAGALTLPSLQLSGTYTVAASAITAWLRNNTVGAVSSVPDVLNPSTPATQPTGARQPTGNADGSITFDGVDDCFLLAVTAANASTAAFAFGGWAQLSSTTGNRALFRRGNGSVPSVGTPGNSFYTELIAASTMRWNINIDASGANVRQAAASVALGTSPFFYLWEFLGSGANDAAKVKLTLNGVVQTLTFGVDSGTAPAMPSALQPAPQAQLIFTSRDAASSGSLAGKASRNLLYIATTPMAGATHVLTPAAIAALMALEPLT